MRVCLVYDCLYPYTVGGAERWYRSLAERLADAGHDVTYLTLRQWERGEVPSVEGVRIVPVGPRLELYANGKRRVLPPVIFGLGVLFHLVRHGRRYDVVHTASFPYFSLLAAALVRPLHRYLLVVDWIEIWTREYWREYLGPVAGWFGWSVQRLGARTKHRAFALARIHAERLRSLGFTGEITLRGGLYDGDLEAPDVPTAGEPVIVFAGRHIPEKRVTAILPALALAREKVPGLRAEVFGDGPDRTKLLQEIERRGLDGIVEAPGFVEGDRVKEALRRALCLVLPSRREGYGLVVVEAAALGTPSVVVNHPDNAATDLVSDGENGFVVESDDPEQLAAAIVRAFREGAELRRSTAEWFRRNAKSLSLEHSLERVLDSYARR